MYNSPVFLITCMKTLFWDNEFRWHKTYSLVHRHSFCDELCQLYDVIYKTRCPTLFHTEHHQSSFIGNFHIFCHWNENSDGFVIFCGGKARMALAKNF